MTRVVVIGAGLAGLTAARYLERAGARVTIVEARDRIGGRVWTLREGFAEDQHGELGADLIEGEQKDVLALAKALKLDAVRILRRGWGLRTRAAGTQAAATTFRDAAKRLGPEVEAFKAAGCRWESGVARELARHSVADWLRRTRADAAFAAGMTALRNFYLADPDDLSLLMLVDQFAEGDAPGASAMYRLRDGNDALPAAIVRELKATIHLDTPVTRLSWRGRRVRIALASRPASELTADFVVCAVPATTVRRIVFEPELPDDQVKAIRTLHYGPATKVLLQFERRFWKGIARRSAYASDGPTGALWDGNEQQARTPGILTLLAGGDASGELHALIVHSGWSGVVRRLRWLGRPSPLLAAASMSWEQDPWSRGGYAVLGPRFDPALRASLARPAGRVVFAGEHTSMKWQGYMNGAVESGRRAAIEVAMLARLPYGGLTEKP